MPSTIPISSLIPIGVTLSPQAAQAQNLSSLLILSGSTVIDAGERMRAYTTLTDVASDFGTDSQEYAEAALWFSQTPQPTGNLFIGCWVQDTTHGMLVGAPLTLAQKQVSNWTSITEGQFSLSIDGSSYVASNLNFTGVTNLDAVASIINNALFITYGTYSDACNWTGSSFVISSPTVGPDSSVTFATDTSGVATQLGLTNTPGNGAYVVPGLLPESLVDCLTAMDSRFGNQWYAVKVIGASNHDVVTAAFFVEASTNKHFQNVTIMDSGTIVSNSTSDLGYILKQGNFNKTAWQYSSSSSAAFTSAMARLLSVDYAGTSTTINLMWKQEPGVIPENLNTDQLKAIQARNGNVLAALSNGTDILLPGKVTSGEWIDTIVGMDNLVIALQTALFNLQYTTLTKIGQDDEDIHQFVACCEAVCEQFVTNGLLGPGVWNYPGVGTVKQGQMLTAGYYVYAQPVATQSLASRAARVTPPINILVYIKGAVNTPNVQISVQQ